MNKNREVSSSDFVGSDQKVFDQQSPSSAFHSPTNSSHQDHFSCSDNESITNELTNSNENVSNGNDFAKEFSRLSYSRLARSTPNKNISNKNNDLKSNDIENEISTIANDKKNDSKNNDNVDCNKIVSVCNVHVNVSNVDKKEDDDNISISSHESESSVGQISITSSVPSAMQGLPVSNQSSDAEDDKGHGEETTNGSITNLMINQIRTMTDKSIRQNLSPQKIRAYIITYSHQMQFSKH